LNLLLRTSVIDGEKISDKTAGFGLGLFISNKISESLSNLKREDGGGIHWEENVILISFKF